MDNATQNSTTVSAPPTLRWVGDAATGRLRLIDQTLLPAEVREIECENVERVWEAIRSLRIRGAPAIGVAAAYAVVLGLQDAAGNGDRNAFDERLSEVTDYLATSRPTAVNLFWALDRMKRTAALEGRRPRTEGRGRRNLEPLALGPRPSARTRPDELLERLLTEAQAIENEDREMCAAIGKVGAELLADNSGVLTHCNAGGLATAGAGTALSVIFEAAQQGKQLHVYADETRPLLQGARLTTWELQQRNIPVTLICDSTAAWVMKEGRVNAVVTGADRIAANGDVANKIGTYAVALLAGAHGIPFYVAAPSSTFDLSLTSGEQIPIEERDPREITDTFGRQTAPSEIDVFNPAFDVTPAEAITAIITEHGLIRPVNAESIREVLDR